ncbi:lipase family protein [Proteus faecis]|uniref:hypothetical protein n=1 Tax=Proteus faecis TaxID=2050967 RepID=UPI000D6861A1|nr:hypothetical protein [Proteus faecis]
MDMNAFFVFMLATVAIMIIGSFGASFIYYITIHRNGTIQYILKIFVIGLMTIPIAILLILSTCYYFFWINGIYKILRYFKLSKSQENNTDDSMEDADIIVHLVHGTFETNASWTLPGSKIREEIKNIGKEIGRNIGISRFCWDGKNTVASRTLAAENLNKHIAQFPQKNQYIIAHSHGGAIVREMSHLQSNDDIAGKIRGVCLLSPPFIFQHEVIRTSGNLGYIFRCSGTLAIQVLLAVFLLPFDLYSYSISGLIFFITLSFEWVLSQKYSNEISEELKKNKDCNSIDFNNIQIFHAIGDEADSALRFISSLHEGCFALLSQLKEVNSKENKLLKCSAIFSSIGYILLAIIYYYDYMILSMAFIFSIILTIIFYLYNLRFKSSNDIPIVLAIAAMPVAIFSFYLSIAKALAYGDLRLIFCPQIFISSSETPIGEYEILKLYPETDSMLIHSTHSHPEAINNIVNWLYSSELERMPKSNL